MLNQNKPLLIGVTGGIGSGKSTVCRVFSCLGVPVYDADSRARWLMNNNDVLKSNIQLHFGESSYENGTLNREYITKIVFSDHNKLGVLNSITHPAVALDFENWVSRHSNHLYLIKEAALLIGSGAFKQLDELILVTAPIKVRVKRVLKRDSQRSESQIKDIIEKQQSETEMARFSNEILQNNGLEPILSQVLKLHKKYSKN